MADPDQRNPLTYREAGVDIDAAAELVGRIKPLAARTARPEVLAGLGGFGALFELPVERFRRPVLVASTDGVGTKLRLAHRLGRHNTIGIDLVAMCANDIVVQGAEPLFFLDYYATGRLDSAVAGDVVEGIAEGCERAGCALIGGETAEMPGMYAAGDYDLAGFCVGVAERDRLVDGRAARPGDVLVGLASSGPHANGYSLIRRVIEDTDADLNQPLTSDTLGQHLLAPTRIYVPLVLSLLSEFSVNAFAHITGGGLVENVPRVLPKDTMAAIDPASWPRPDIFGWIQSRGNVADSEMLRTFNCGIGMVAVVPKDQSEAIIDHCFEQGIAAWEIGEVRAAPDREPFAEMLA